MHAHGTLYNLINLFVCFKKCFVIVVLKFFLYRCWLTRLKALFHNLAPLILQQLWPILVLAIGTWRRSFCLRPYLLLVCDPVRRHPHILLYCNGDILSTSVPRLTTKSLLMASTPDKNEFWLRVMVIEASPRGSYIDRLGPGDIIVSLLHNTYYDSCSNATGN